MDSIIFEYYGIDWIMILMTIIAFIVGLNLRIWVKDKSLKLIMIYLGLTIIMDITSILAVLVFKNINITYTANFFYTPLEPFLFLRFVYLNLTGQIHKQLLKVTLGLYLAFWLAVTIFRLSPFIVGNNVGIEIGCESFFAVLGALIYFNEQFACVYHYSLLNKPDFWVVTGILFYSAASIPIFLLKNYSSPNAQSFYIATDIINYALYTILFILFMKAFICRSQKSLR